MGHSDEFVYLCLLRRILEKCYEADVYSPAPTYPPMLMPKLYGQIFEQMSAMSGLSYNRTIIQVERSVNHSPRGQQGNRNLRESND